MGDPISVSGKKRDWLGLKRKISKGIPIEEAALQCGIPMDEVFTHVSDNMDKFDTLNFQLRAVGQGAIQKALTKLTELASGDQRLGNETMFNDDGKPYKSVSWKSDDLEAAKTLAKLGMDAVKMAKSGAAPDHAAANDDLFDKQNPWVLKKVE